MALFTCQSDDYHLVCLITHTLSLQVLLILERATNNSEYVSLARTRRDALELVVAVQRFIHVVHSAH